MRLAPAPHRAYSYQSSQSTTVWPVTLTQAKLYLKISASNTTDDDLIKIFLTAATSYAEEFTRRTFITRTFTTFRDYFSECVSEGYYQFGNIPSASGGIISAGGNVGFELRRSKLIAITSINYLVDGTFTLVDASTYYNTLENDYSEVLTLDGQQWPTNADRRLQAIKIIFTAGYGTASTDQPGWVQEGILQHVANMYENRGDCSNCGDTAGDLLPATARLLYLQNRIENL